MGGIYLKHSLDIDVKVITEASVFKSTFFPYGFKADKARFMERAYIYPFLPLRKLQNLETVKKCIQCYT